METRFTKKSQAAEGDLKGQREFSTRLVLELAKRPGNLFVSPFSAWSLLAMLHPGARGDTRERLEEVLGIGDEVVADRVLGRIRDLMSTSLTKKQFELIVANGLWVQEGYQLRPDYVREVSDRFGARLEEVDFQRRPDTACGTINSWADENTCGRIRKVLSPAEINALTRLVLANATYFKDKWLFPFERDLTEPKPFHRLDGGDVEVQMMHQEAQFSYFEDRRLQAVRLPYKGSGVSMTVILPRKTRKFEAKLTPDSLVSLLEAPYEEEHLFLALPRYRFESTLRLVNSLGELGLSPLFGPAADLSGLSKEAGVFVNEVKQVNFVEIDEKGTQAAAVTIGLVGATAVFSPAPKPKVMIVDRPYWFFIRDESAGITLFAGRVEDPS